MQRFFKVFVLNGEGLYLVDFSNVGNKLADGAVKFHYRQPHPLSNVKRIRLYVNPAEVIVMVAVA
jgi:hypothetical protein